MNANKKTVVGANLGYRKHWDACTAEERQAIVGGELAVLERARLFNRRKDRENGYVQGWTREECLTPVPV